MHILIIVENLPVPFDRRVWSEATTLRDAGHEVSVICPQGPAGLPEHEVLEGIEIWRHPLQEAKGGAAGYLREYAQALSWESRLAWRVWRRRRFQVIHICNPPDLLFLVTLPFKLLGVRVVFDHHDLGPELFFEKFGRREPLNTFMRLAERLTFLTADHVISTNESYAAVARQRGRKHPDAVTVVRSGPDLRRFLRRPSARGEGGPVVGYVGVMAEQDGVHLLIRAVAEVVGQERWAGLRVVLVGDGPSRQELEALGRELGVSEHLDFTGFLSGEAFLAAISTFDVGVCPDPKNPYNDRCTMNKVLEYMTLGIPVVQFDLVEGRRSAGDAALYAGEHNDPAELATAIARLLDDPALRERLGKEGRRRMEEELAWHHQAPRLVQAYEALRP